ncbi:MAG: MFS transporter [Promethearchaeota archaeon]|nr:MAG: MFS transporter [Candidatus Lokiarchaeota archaeon]
MSQENSNITSLRSRRYLIYLLFMMVLVQILDTYTQFYLTAIPSEIKKSFLADLSKNTADSVFAIAVAVASIGTYIAFFVWYLADRVGRRPLLIVTVIGLSVGSLGIYFSNNIVDFTIFYLVIWVFGASDLWLMFVNEEAPPDKKGFWTNIVLVGGMIGAMLIPIFRAIYVTDTSPVGSWKGMALFPVFLGIPLCLIIIITVKETSKYEEIKKSKQLEKQYSLIENVKRIFSSKYRIALIAIFVMYFLRGLNNFTRQLGEIVLSETFEFTAGEVAILIVVMNLATVLGYLVAGKLSDIFGRKTVLYILTIIYNIGSLLFIWVLFIPTEHNLAFILIIISSSLTNIAFWAFWTFLSIIVIEMTPTDARGTASGFKLLIGAIANTLGLILTAIVALYFGLAIAFVIFGTLFVLYYPIIRKYIIETKDIDLSEIK